MARYPRRGGRRQWWHSLNALFLNPKLQYLSIVVIAIVLAATVFSGFLLVRYSDTQDLLSKGQQALKEGKVAFAVRYFQSLISHQPNNYEARIWLGETYLQMGERKKAEQEFQVASLLRDKAVASGQGSGTPESDRLQRIAMAKLSEARKEYPEAEAQLLQAYKADRQEPSIKQALFDLYENWGSLLLEEKKLPEAADKLEKALPFVQEFEREEGLRHRLVECLLTMAKQSLPEPKEKEDSTEENASKEPVVAPRGYEKALMLYKRALRHQYAPNTLIALADAYEQAGQLDEALMWYRKAFQVDPSVIGLKLFNVLQEKGLQLTAKGNSQAAERFYEEARHISRMAQMKPETLYPLKLTHLSVQPGNWNPSTGRFVPILKGTLQNDSDYEIPFLELKADLMLGDQLFATLNKPLVTQEEKLAPKAAKGSIRPFSLEAQEPLSAFRLEHRDLKVNLYVSYSQGEPREWVLKAVHKASVSFPPPPKRYVQQEEQQPTLQSDPSLPPVPNSTAEPT